MTTATATVTDAQAEQVRKAIAIAFDAHPDYEPTLMEEGWDDRTGRVIDWVNCHFEWSYYVPDGGIDWESGHEFPPITLPDGVRIEAINHYSIAVYPA
ncbi:hypothetical protein [Streptosporangium sp. NPDC001681]|uniref:hypothetical protein n=1 Tax=Streptosporangium sp. NPDC001681 TaxID=3154395 RepID=UPI00332C06CD